MKEKIFKLLDSNNLNKKKQATSRRSFPLRSEARRKKVENNSEAANSVQIDTHLRNLVEALSRKNSIE